MSEQTNDGTALTSAQQKLTKAVGCGCGVHLTRDEMLALIEQGNAVARRDAALAEAERHAVYLNGRITDLCREIAARGAEVAS